MSERAQANMKEKKPPATDSAWLLLFMAWLVSLIASLGALFIGEIMGQAPCVLCWYQRAFMFPLAVILAVGAFRSDGGAWRYGLPLAIIGTVIAAYHSMLYAGILTEALEPCGQGPSCTDTAMTILGAVPLPALSLVSFLIIAILLLSASRTKHS